MRRPGTRTASRAIGRIWLLGVAASASAQNAGQAPLYVDLGQCIGIESAEQRFACFDERFAAALAARDADRTAGASGLAAGRPSDAIASQAAVASGPPGVPAVAAFGSPQSAAPAVSAAEPAPEEITGTIAALRELGRGRWVITLDNDQVWQTSQAVRFPLRVGLDVRLNATRWGPDYRLTAVEFGRHVQVSRVR